MDNLFYTSEKNILTLISLLKAFDIKRVIASPGTTNITFVMSLKHDKFFEIYSAPDERSAAYIACGMAATDGKPVVLTCTGATASRNYIPGLTEAFYRKLPILAVTSTQHIGRIGNAIPQVIDRSNPLNDIAKISVHLPMIHDNEDEWSCNVAANKAIGELFRNGGGPVHINLETSYSKNYSIQELPRVRAIKRYEQGDNFPEINAKKVAIFIGAHIPWSDKETKIVDEFCKTHNAVVFCDWSSNYFGKYRCDFTLVSCQGYINNRELLPELVIHIGEISGDYELYGIAQTAQVWRVNPDGEIRDTFRKLTAVFEMPESVFFKHYTKSDAPETGEYAQACNAVVDLLRSDIPELPFSNLWMASKIAPKLPQNSVLHLAILNTLRSWNIIAKNPGITGFCNTGGFGIDGSLSTFLGSSLALLDKLHFCVIGDLAFFYDMNALGNRHVNKNMRILLINNGNGTEFRNYNHPAYQFGDEAREFVSADGHYGKQSPTLIKHYAEDLGFEYMSANNKNEFEDNLPRFISPEITDKPILFEAFTNSSEENTALFEITHMVKENVDFAHYIARKVLTGNLRKIIYKFISNIK